MAPAGSTSMTRDRVVSSSSSSSGRLLARWCHAVSIGALAVSMLCAGPVGAQQPGAADLAAARQLFDALDYEHAMPLLDRVITTLEPMASRDPATRKTLVSAYEMRARARFGTGDRDGVDLRFPGGPHPRSVVLAGPGRVAPRRVAARRSAVHDGGHARPADDAARRHGHRRRAVVAGGGWQGVAGRRLAQRQDRQGRIQDRRSDGDDLGRAKRADSADPRTRLDGPHSHHVAG